jgi:hypothetical protein
MSQQTNEIELYLSKLLEDLATGHTWLKKDDKGYGSIQEKYGATDIEIKIIRKNPLLEGKEPTFRVFKIVNDLSGFNDDPSKTKPVIEEESYIDIKIENKIETNLNENIEEQCESFFNI